MKLHRWKDIAARRHTPRKLAELDAKVDRELLEMDLRAMRELLGKTQKEISKATSMTQPQLSRIEHGEDHRLSTIRTYVKGLGGELEVIAHFGDKTIRLHSV